MTDVEQAEEQMKKMYLRLDCLRLAANSCQCIESEKIVKEAEKLYKFITEKSD
jgi:hypothetical protein